MTKVTLSVYHPAKKCTSSCYFSHDSVMITMFLPTAVFTIRVASSQSGLSPYSFSIFFFSALG